MKFYRSLALVAASATVLCACGGGGGGGAPAAAPPPPVQPPPVANYSAAPLAALAGDTRAQAEDLNDIGQVVGWSSGGAAGQTAVLWTLGAGGAATVESLGKLPGGSYGSAQAVNNSGVIVGFADDGAGMRRPVAWIPGTGIRDLGLPAGMVAGQAHQVNDNGQVIGAVFEVSPAGLVEDGRTVIWRIDAAGNVLDMANLGVMGGAASAPWDNNSLDHVAGNIWYGSSQQGFFWTEASGPSGIGGEEALGINDVDEIVGVDSISNDGFVWSSGAGRTRVSIGILMDINNQGVAAGRADIGDSDQQAFIWEDGTAELLPNPPGAVFSWAMSINEAGSVVGWGVDANDDDVALLWMPNDP